MWQYMILCIQCLAWSDMQNYSFSCWLICQLAKATLYCFTHDPQATDLTFKLIVRALTLSNKGTMTSGSCLPFHSITGPKSPFSMESIGNSSPWNHSALWQFVSNLGNCLRRHYMLWLISCQIGLYHCRGHILASGLCARWGRDTSDKYNMFWVDENETWQNGSEAWCCKFVCKKSCVLGLPTCAD